MKIALTVKPLPGLANATPIKTVNISNGNWHSETFKNGYRQIKNAEM